MLKEINTARLVWLRNDVAHSEGQSIVPHQLIMLVDLMDVYLVSTWFDYSFHVGPAHLCCSALMRQGANHEHDHLSKLRAERQPQGVAKALMTRVNGAWQFFWLFLSPKVMLSRRCPVSLCYPVVYGQAVVGLICTLTPALFQHSLGHSRMIKYCARWELGAGSPQAVH